MPAIEVEPSVEAGREFRRQLAERAAQQAESPEVVEAKKSRKQVMLTAVAAVLFGVLANIVGFIVIGGGGTGDLARRLGLAGALTAVVYAVVAVLVSHQLGRSMFRPRLSEGSLWRSIAFGALWGGGAAILLGVLISLVAGQATSDPRMVGVLFEGNAIHIFVAAFLAVVAAPVIEEVLFRGLVLESLRKNGRTTALLGSAVLFSLWHVNPAALRYYVLLGFLAGVLYWRFGLAGSISAHFAFNGVLLVVAFLALVNPTTVRTDTGVSLELPAGWYEIDPESVGPTIDVAAESPVGSALIVDHIDSPSGDIALPQPNEVPPSYRNPRFVSVAGARSLLYDTNIEGDDAQVVLVPQGSRGYTVTLIPMGSEKAAGQFDEILQTISFGG